MATDRDTKYKDICHKIVKCLNAQYSQYNFAIKEEVNDVGTFSSLALVYEWCPKNYRNIAIVSSFLALEDYPVTYHKLFNRIVNMFNAILQVWTDENYSHCIAYDNVFFSRMFGKSLSEANVKCDLLINR